MYTEETPSSMSPSPEVINPDRATPDLKDFQTSLKDLKQELSRVRGLERTEILSKLQEIETLGEHFEQWLNQPSVGNGDRAKGKTSYSPAQREQLLNLAQQIQDCPTLETLLNFVCVETMKISQAQRCLIYQFDGETHGKVVAEKVDRGWTPAQGETLPATIFGRDEAEEYLQAGLVSLNSSDRATPYQQQLLDRFQVQSSLALVLRIDGKAWGLLVMHNCQSPEPFSDNTINLLYQISTELALKLATFDYQALLKAEKNREQTKVAIISRIRQSQDLDTIFEVATQEIRRALNCDRVGIYRFNEDWSGGFVAEAVTTGWTPLINGGDPAGDVKNDCSLRMLSGEKRARDSEDTYLQDTKGGGYVKGKKYSVVNDIYEMGFPRCYLDQLEKYECRAYINIPIFQGDKLWGLMAAYQNSGPRQWTDSEKDLMVEVADPLGVALNQAEYIEQLQAQTQREAAKAQQEKTKATLISRIRQSQDLDTIFETATQEVRRVLNCDRVGIYRFNEDWSGGFVAEAVTTGWTPLINGGDPAGDVKNDCSLRMLSGEKRARDSEDTYLQDTKGGGYVKGKKYSVVNDIYEMGFPRCYLDQLEKYECRAYINIPIFQGDKLWGLMAAYQNSGPRQWTDSEKDLMVAIADPLGVALNQAEFIEQLEQKNDQLAQGVEREKTVSKIVDRIRRTPEVNAVFNNTTQEVLNVLKADRVALYKFYEDWSGEFVAESVASGWKHLVGTEEAKVKDTYLRDNQGGRYALGQNHVVPDIYQEGFDSCHIELLETFQCRAYILVPVFQDDVLWGILGVYQNSAPRQWEDSEVQLTRQVGTQFGVALKQAQYLEQIQQQSNALAEAAEREQAVSKVVDKIRRSQEVNEIFETTTQEVRLLLKADRVGLYEFGDDWSGEFVAESVATGWQPLVGTSQAKVKDTYLQENKGGRYARGESHVVPDIYREGFDSCHIELLETFQCRAYILVPVFQDDVLWGILGVYQNGEARQWQEQEVKLLRQIGVQLGIALKQAEFLGQIRQQSEQLAEAAERERQAKELLQQRAIELLTAVRPALDGNLTVRAPVTDDELGTIADAYNNTLRGLRQIVIQVQEAVEKVGQTSMESDEAINQLSQRATQQSQALEGALDQVESMTHATEDVANNAQAINKAVQKSNETVASGDAAMNRTVDGIQGIRDAVSETSRNIRQLGESSQKISRVVNLISDFSKQTQLLSLNASIEATRAGEYGRGFAVVADEVRSLARQSADATKEIEDLVAEIRNQTSEAIKVTERAIAQVSAGTNLVQETKEELNAIAAATAQISNLVAGITEASQGQLQQSQYVTQTMQDVAAIANATSEQSNALSASFKEALETAQQLRSAVDKFTI